MRRLSNRAWILLMLAICLAVTASAAGLVLSRHGAQAAAAPRSGSAAPAAPGSAQARADLAQMQSLLNSGSVAKQAALLVPPMKFAPGSKPIFPAGTTVTIRQGTFRPDGQQFGTVQASAGGKAVTLDLYAVQGHWHLIGVKTGAQTRAAVTPRPGSQPVMRLMSATTAYNYVPLPKEIKARKAVILVHGWMPGQPSDWGSDSKPDSMFAVVNQLRGTWVSAFDYSPTNGEWFGHDSNGPALATYIRAVSQASTEGGGDGKVIIVAHSMGGLLTRYAANQTIGGHPIADDIGMVITLGTPNTGSFWANAGDDARKILCWEQTNNAQNFQFPSDFCRNWTALAGMSVLGPQISHLKELPDSIPLFAIAGNEILHWRLGLSVVDMPLDGDAVVSLSSALHHRPAGGTSSYTKIQNPPRVYDISAWHGDLPKNRDIIAMVHDLIYAYVQAHPPPAPAQAPASGPCYNPQCEVPLSPSPSATPLYHQPVANNTVKPGTVEFSGDATNIFTATNGWSNWGSASTTATGLITYEGCVPDCARGTQTPTPATVTFSGLVSGEYTTVTEVILSGPAAGTAYSNAPLTGTWPWVNA